MSLDLEIIKNDPYLWNNKENIEKIYEKMNDDKSREMYREALNLIATRDFSHLVKIHELNKIKTDKAILQQIQYSQFHEQGKKIIFYGLGQRTLNMVKMWEEFHSGIGYSFFPFITDIPVSFFCDKNYRNYSEGFLGKPVISPSDLKQNYKDGIVIINTCDYFEQIYNELLGEGFSEEQMFFHEYPNGQACEEKQYFEEFMKIDQEQTFVDAGCYDGKTVHQFINWQPNYEKVIAFEPDKTNYTVCTKNLQDVERIEVIQAGLGNENCRVSFKETATSGSCIDRTGEDFIDVIKLDDVIEKDKISFIKMDIEGAELDALRGAQKVIHRDHPKLAICVYHKKYDLVELPQYINEISDNYVFYLRIYSNLWFECVLYAVPKQLCKSELKE